MSSLVEYLEGFDPLLSVFNTYSLYLYLVLFAGLFLYTKNLLALVIVGESIIGYVVNNYFDLHILTITGQFIIYGFSFYLCRKNSLISLSYLILLSHFLIQYISNSMLLATNTLVAYNLAMLVYYLFYAMLPIVLFLMVKGLFSDWGKWRESDRFYIDTHRFDGFDYAMPNNYHSRFERLFKKSNQRV